MQNKVCFKYVKLTNNRKPPKGQITLYSMHKYIPCVLVLKYKSKKKPEIVHVQDFPLASFFAVRRMFPFFSVSVSGLEQKQKYIMKKICNVRDDHYGYIDSVWIDCGRADDHVKKLLSYTHKDSPASGRYLDVE